VTRQGGVWTAAVDRARARGTALPVIARHDDLETLVLDAIEHHYGVPIERRAAARPSAILAALRASPQAFALADQSALDRPGIEPALFLGWEDVPQIPTLIDDGLPTTAPSRFAAIFVRGGVRARDLAKARQACAAAGAMTADMLQDQLHAITAYADLIAGPQPGRAEAGKGQSDGAE